MAAVFLEKDDIVILTDRKTKKKQIEALRKMGVAFFVNARGWPVVTRSAVEGRKEDESLAKQKWVPKVLGGK